MVLLAMVRAMLNQEGKSPDSLPEWLRDYPVTIIQFLFFLYHNMADFMPVFMGGDVLGALAGTLFPRQPGSETGSGSSTPSDESKVFFLLINFLAYILIIKPMRCTNFSNLFLK